jgi:hypothetical protein
VGSGLGHAYITQVEAWAAGEGCTIEEKDARMEGLKPVKTKLSQSIEKMKGLTEWCERDRKAVTEWAAAATF